MTSFLNEGNLPPYLRVQATPNNTIRNSPKAAPGPGSPNGEGDVAGGSVLQRVSSFSYLRSNHFPRPKVQEDKEAPIQDTVENKDVAPAWRLKDRMKTVGIGIVMSLNVGTDPPDITKPHPCAKLQCWMDPASISRAKAKEMIGERLEAQYAKWQPQRAANFLKYRRALDPTVEDVRAVCLGLRRQARNERILLHYNGHGVPRPTANGEIWVFDKNHSQYIPLYVTDLRQWMGKPSIVVFDCSCAGILIPFLTAPLESSDATPPDTPPTSDFLPSDDDDIETAASQWVRDTIVLCPTSDTELLPMHPDYPADIFTSCLTTPIKMALRWFVRRNPQSMGGLNPDAVDAVPGKANDRKTPLGELNWIFTAVTDSIAWNILPKPLFQRLFRQDLLVASMFRNFLLADRILRSLNCSPQSYPPLPPGVCDHPLWQAWDLACETCLTGLMKDGILGNHVLVTTQPDPNRRDDESQSAPETKVAPPPIKMGPASSVTSPFFSEQLTAFEIWLEFATINKSIRPNEPLESPEQLPVVLQVLMSQAHRVRALRLLRQFLELGPWAVNLSLSLGIFPYVLKLLQSPEYKESLVGIWARILSFDPSCQADLVKDGGALPHFVQHLTWGLNKATMNLPLNPVEAAEQRILAAFILSVTCVGYPQGQMACMRQNLHGTCCALLSSVESAPDSELDPDYQRKIALAEERVPANFRLWLCLCLGNLVKGNNSTQTEAVASGVYLRLFQRLKDNSPGVRAAASFAIGSLLSLPPRPDTNVLSPVAPMSPSTQQRPTLFNGPGPGEANIQNTSRIVAQQPMMIPPQVSVGPTGGFLTGRMQPTFVPQGVNNGMGWQPQQLQIGMVQNAVPGPGQPLQQSMTYKQGMSSNGMQGTAMGMMTATSPPGRAQSTPQTNLPGNSQEKGTVEHAKIDPLLAFQDRRRLDVDLLLSTTILTSLNDGNPAVRYEGVVVLGKMVGKYRPGFLAVSEEMTMNCDNDNMDSSSFSISERILEEQRSVLFPFPEGHDDGTIQKFRVLWRSLRETQHTDVHPSVASAANNIVSFVHHNILQAEIHHDTLEENGSQDALRSRGGSIGTRTLINASDGDLRRLLSPAGNGILSSPPQSAGPPRRQDALQSDHLPLRRTSSEFKVTGAGRQDRSASKNAKDGDAFKMDYTLPKSEFFEWKRDVFLSESQSDTIMYESMDPLSPSGALKSYLWRRNDSAKKYCAKISDYYSSLAPKPPKSNKDTLNDVLLMDEDEAAANLAEEKLSQKKKTLSLKQTGLLKNVDASSTSLLLFHPYENALVICDGQSGISVWDVNKGTRELTIENGNLHGSRFTSTCWINEKSNSLLVAGCSDGSVRVWGGIPLSRAVGDPSVSLASAFQAVPDLSAKTSKSGLILDWQEYSGKLLATGTDRIRSWDMHTETCCHEMKTESEAWVTTLSTAWRDDLFEDGKAMGNSYGAGPNLLVAGFSDGSLKVFDTRMNLPVADTNGASKRGRKQRALNYKEHGSWVVSTAFTGYDNHYEIVSGSILGDVKIFDLRASRSIQSYKVQRSPMTAMSVHPFIPMIATGSDAQFVKLMTLDGDSIQVIKNSELNHNRPMGPISGLAFHPHRTVLAVGGTDNHVHLFSQKNALDLL